MWMTEHTKLSGVYLFYYTPLFSMKGEMCYVFLAYYPEMPNFTACHQAGTYDVSCPSATNKVYHYCVHTFVGEMETRYKPLVKRICYARGNSLCTTECRETLDKVTGKGLTCCVIQFLNYFITIISFIAYCTTKLWIYPQNFI